MKAMREFKSGMLAFHIIASVWCAILFYCYLNSDYPNSFLRYLTDISDGRGFVLVVSLSVVDGVVGFVLFCNLVELIFYGKRKWK